jgi:ElaB/YqjD/DUF883 family membrane-anchored ribosome-binding protein
MGPGPDESTDELKRQMDQTRGALADKLEALEQHVVGTVQDAAEAVASVRTAVSDTVDSVKSTVRETVDTVAETVDLQKQFDRHPWPMMAGAAAVGFIGGALLFREDKNGGSSTRRSASPATPAYHPPEPQKGGTSGESGWMDALRPTAQRLRSLAVSASLGLARDLLVRQLPPAMAQQVQGIFDDATVELGGHPLRQFNLAHPQDVASASRPPTPERAHF